jgi:hypothetical protein
MKACVTCSKPATLGICLPCAERAESMLFAVTPWTPFEKATLHPDVAKEGFDQCWKNSRYTVLVRYMKDTYGDDLVHLSVKRNDKNPMHDWRDMQRIKNEILGDEEEAMELYPAESRLVDTANQYHLWCFAGRKAPFGYNSERCVMEEVGNVCGGTGKQRPFEEKPADLMTDEQWRELFTKKSKERQLAAAAGDLLEALKGCMDQIEAYDPGGCKPGLPYDRLKAARTAIAKATEEK